MGEVRGKKGRGRGGRLLTRGAPEVSDTSRASVIAQHFWRPHAVCTSTRLWPPNYGVSAPAKTYIFELLQKVCESDKAQAQGHEAHMITDRQKHAFSDPPQK